MRFVYIDMCLCFGLVSITALLPNVCTCSESFISLAMCTPFVPSFLYELYNDFRNVYSLINFKDILLGMLYIDEGKSGPFCTNSAVVSLHQS